MHVSNLKSTLERAWNRRISGDLEGCIVDFKGIKLQAGSDSIGGGVDKINWDHPDADLLVDIIMMEASIARAQRLFEKSSALVNAVARCVAERGETGTFRLHMEAGLTRLLAGEFSHGLEHFITAHNLAVRTEDPEKKLLALANSVLCMESLGLSYARSLQEVEHLMMELPSSPITKSIQTQMLSLQAREFFASGNIRAILSLPEANGVTTQLTYQKAWLRALPYIGVSDASSRSKDLEFAALNFGSLHNGPYRLRTLLGTVHSDDKQSIKLSDAIDRLYLWVWRWLVDPQHFSFARILHVLSDIGNRDHSDRMTNEDAGLLTNACLWLGLFAQSMPEDILAVVNRLTAPNRTCSPFFQYERRIIELSYARREHDDILAKTLESELLKGPFGHSNGIAMGELVAQRSSQHLNSLKLALDRLCASIDPDKRFVVDLRSSEVHDQESGEKIVSHALSTGLDLLHKTRSITCADMLSECFGLHHYDSFVHDKKIYNLLSRMKSLFSPHLQFMMKEGRVYADGDWGAISFLTKTIHQKQVDSDPDWKTFMQQARTLSPKTPSKINISSELADQWVTRAHLESLLNLPRSTTSRIISKLEQQGLLEKKGYTKLARYRLSQQLIDKIASGEPIV